MRYMVTEQVRKAVRDAVGDKWGGMSRLAERAGVHMSLVSSIIRGTHPVIQEDRWIRLCNAIPGLVDLASPENDSFAPLSIQSGNHSPITIGGDVGAYRLRVIDRIVALGLPPDILQKVLAILREEAR